MLNRLKPKTFSIASVIILHLIPALVDILEDVQRSGKSIDPAQLQTGWGML